MGFFSEVPLEIHSGFYSRDPFEISPEVPCENSSGDSFVKLPGIFSGRPLGVSC